MHDGLTRFDYTRGSWVQVDDVTLPTFVRWVLDRSLTFHSICRRYPRIRLPGSNATIRRSASWTTQRSIDAEAKHEAMRQLQEAAMVEREECAREAEEHRKQAERERQRQEDKRRRVEAEKRHREFMIESERRQAAWEAQRREQERKQQEQERQEELARRERDSREQTAAQHWWEEIAAAQLAELLDHITALSMSEHASRALPRSDKSDREHAIRHRPLHRPPPLRGRQAVPALARPTP